MNLAVILFLVSRMVLHRDTVLATASP